MSRVIAAALFFLVSATATAQEFDIFDPNDFIDPRERGAVFTSARIGVSEPGNDFYLVRLYGGQVRSYQWRSASTHADPAFFHVAGSFYRGDKQLNVKWTGFRASHNADLPSFRGTLQLGQYFISNRNLPADEEKKVTGRILATWSIEQNPFRDNPDSRHVNRINHEFGVEADVQLGNVDGAFIWMRRRIERGVYVDRVSYFYRLRERLRSNQRLHLNAALGVGAERVDGFECCLARAIFTATYVIPRLDTGFNIAIAPTYSPAGSGRRLHKEYAVYLDRTVIARLRDVVTR